MYSGTTIRRGSGKIIGTHQKIDRVARRKLQQYLPRVSLDSNDRHSEPAEESTQNEEKRLPDETLRQAQGDKTKTSRRKLRKAMKTSFFPTSREIIKFEGLNGPDGIKKKSPAKDEPWHFINPADPNDRQILELIQSGEQNLIKALRDNNREKAAFEAAWLSHALVDGLTPAHHYPYEAKMEEIRGESLATRTTLAKKVIMPGETVRKKLTNNWEYWNLKDGLLTAHSFFEWGVATITASMRFTDVKLSRDDRLRVQRAGGITPFYLDIIREIYSMHMFDEFLQTSWTPRLAKLTKNELMPVIIHTVLLSWYYCAWAARENS
ncbi:hypothetical protein FWG95_02560 [Candidatus Saccharibacteria bacterium]|nr:hypothetical protein [Candidatus Saccharibacteria bacterium]